MNDKNGVRLVVGDTVQTPLGLGGVVEITDHRVVVDFEEAREDRDGNTWTTREFESNELTYVSGF